MNTEIAKPERTEFIENTKQWVTLDSQLKIINEKTKAIREMKRQLTEKICEYKNNNNIHNVIKLSDGELRFYEKREQTPLSFSYIEYCLEQILTDEEQIEFVMNYIRENREVSVTTDIKRVYANK